MSDFLSIFAGSFNFYGLFTGITTLEEMAEYINNCDDFPLAAYDIIAINGWTDDTAEIFGVCSFGNHRVVLKEGVAEVVEL